MTLDDQIRQLLDRALAGFRTPLESELRNFAQELLRASADERSRAVAQATDAAVAEVRHKAHAQLAQIRDAAQKHADDLRRSADAQIAELKRALEAARNRAQADVEDARRVAQTQVDDVQRVMEERLASLQARLAEADRRVQSVTAEMDEVRKRSAADAEELVTTQLATAAAEHERRQAAAVAEARAQAGQLERDHTNRLVHAVRMLDDARSLGEVLEILAQGAARETERVAVLVVRGERLAGWSLVGFGDRAAAAHAIDLDLEGAGLPGRVIRTGAAASRSAMDAEGPSLPPFAQDGASRDALALPVVVGGTAVAVLYADGVAGDTRAVDRWPAVLDVLARHASRVLEAMTVQQAIGLSLPRPMARASHIAVAGLSHDRGVQ